MPPRNARPAFKPPAEVQRNLDRNNLAAIPRGTTVIYSYPEHEMSYRGSPRTRQAKVFVRVLGNVTAPDGRVLVSIEFGDGRTAQVSLDAITPALPLAKEVK
jgi:hypothetical protein